MFVFENLCAFPNAVGNNRKPPEIWLMAAKNVTVGQGLNFRVYMLLKTAVSSHFNFALCDWHCSFTIQHASFIMQNCSFIMLSAICKNHPHSIIRCLCFIFCHWSRLVECSYFKMVDWRSTFICYLLYQILYTGYYILPYKFLNVLHSSNYMIRICYLITAQVLVHKFRQHQEDQHGKRRKVCRFCLACPYKAPFYNIEIVGDTTEPWKK